ncbi:aminoglycoside phosphotransferase family protein [Ensifer aridi]|uniref:aminoglycoside phosphotransferase family protein n=1 Tax=Ensifer aridi TaxID=1708715 RepID=UPI00196A0472
MFTSHIEQWALEPEGEPIITRSSHLLPVLWRGKPAMLKVAREPEEKAGGTLMQWWNGRGAARVYACADDAILLERAESRCSGIAIRSSTRCMCGRTSAAAASAGL